MGSKEVKCEKSSPKNGLLAWKEALEQKNGIMDLTGSRPEPKKTETLWTFFGLHTANAVRMINKITPEHVPKQAT